ncbi:MAG TPA: pantetheine-phosphate adenylyltransferase [Clostridia bacterium]|nr:pantetheine-phosphate adenylyltransferase [Clostridia bacterium]
MRVAVYPGTFDPITNGHLDILERAVHLFDRVIVAIAVENYKDTLFSLEERRQLVESACKNLPRTEVRVFDGLLMEFVEAVEARAIIRGLRAVSDFEYEMQMAMMNKRLNNQVETVFLMSATKYSFLSSSIIKQVALLDGSVKGLVPQEVEEALKQKYAMRAAGKEGREW